MRGTPRQIGPGFDAPPADVLVQAVLDCVRSIPSGRVMTYGDVAEFVGWRGPRWVGRVLSEYGADDGDGPLPWHRVVPVTGLCALPVRVEQMRRLGAEGVAMRDGRIDLRTARWSCPGGYVGQMTEDDAAGRSDHRADSRAHLLPEEQATGPSDDARHQAEIILADSDRRTAEPEETLHESAQTPERPSHPT